MRNWQPQRVVITGLGLITPLGIGVKATWNGLLEGKSGIGLITRFDTTDYATKIAAEVKGFNPEDYIEKKTIKQMDTFIHYALAASFMALEAAGLGKPENLGERCGVLIGTGIGGLPEIERTHKELLESGPRRVSPFFIPRLIANLAAGQVAIATGSQGPINCTVTACAASSHAIGDAFRLIQRGDADMMITGGTESVITPLTVAGFSSMRAMSRRNDQPEKASRPFDKERDGFVIGEGSGILIIESLAHAEKRDATPLAEITGYGMSSDGYHITAPPPEGVGAQRCMRLALKDAELDPTQIDYINAHGTSTPLNDQLETEAIKGVFGAHAKKLKISSTKSMTGHLLGAAGGIEAAFTAMMIKEGRIVPTINYENPDPVCDLDYVPNKAIQFPIKHAISNSFGFGGANACLVFSKI
jgi:3-oxoacyl-[acyl-carrier-protein] synthase II